MIVLILNCGSSSVKYQLLDMKSEEEYTLKSKGVIERIGDAMGVLKHQYIGSDEKFILERPFENHTEAVKVVLEALTDKDHGVISELSEIKAIGHRVLHGGPTISASQLVTPEIEHIIDVCSDLGPLHNPANLAGIRAVKAVLPEIPQVAVFDTAFHNTMPEKVYTYAIPHEYLDKYGIRKYGFHGTSHRYVSAKAIKMGGLDPENSKVITCHMGNGSSITAILNGKSYDTTMGLTPLEGLMMGTRSGSIDPEVVTYIMKKEGKTPEEMTKLLNKKSGFIGVSELTSDMRDMHEFAEEGKERAKLVISMLEYQIAKYIGGFAAAMGGVDMIAITGGIGENNPWFRHDVMKSCEWLGVKIDEEANIKYNRADGIITAPDSKVKVAIICTNEELVIAQDTMRIVESLGK